MSWLETVRRFEWCWSLSLPHINTQTQPTPYKHRSHSSHVYKYNKYIYFQIKTHIRERMWHFTELQCCKSELVARVTSGRRAGNVSTSSSFCSLHHAALVSVVSSLLWSSAVVDEWCAFIAAINQYTVTHTPACKHTFINALIYASLWYWGAVGTLWLFKYIF